MPEPHDDMTKGNPVPTRAHPLFRPVRATLLGLAMTIATSMLAQTAAAEDTIDSGDTAWMITSTLLVLLMTLPGLALFYGGLVRTKNLLSILMQCLISRRNDRRHVGGGRLLPGFR